MLPSARALLTGILDYAGLFPPAQLPMAEAVRRFRGHQTGGDGWMLARFVIPAGRLAELPPLLGGTAAPQPAVRLAVLVRPADLDGDLADIESFTGRHGALATVEQLELRLPHDPRQIAGIVGRSAAAIRRRLPSATAFFEPSLLDRWPEQLACTIDALGAVPGHDAVGLKIRCGGLDAPAVPSPQAVAAALAACRLAGVPLKATQGLHQPLRHLDGGLGATVHGFLNLLVAGVLGHLHALSERELLAIVEEVEAAAFRFDDNGLAWAGLAAGLDAIAAGRRAAVTSFGSCSFAEPRDALRELGLLDRGGPTASRSGPERGGRTTENGTD